MGICLSLAQMIGLHRDPRNSCMDKRRQRIWKRMWWSIYTRDRFIALGMRRPTRVQDDGFHVPMLTLDDFGLHAFSPETASILGGSDVFQSVQRQKELALMFIEKTRLCQCTSRVLPTQYSVLGHRLGGAGDYHDADPELLAAETPEFRLCAQELEDWLAHLPLDIHYSPAAPKKLTEA